MSPSIIKFVFFRSAITSCDVKENYVTIINTEAQTAIPATTLHKFAWLGRIFIANTSLIYTSTKLVRIKSLL